MPQQHQLDVRPLDIPDRFNAIFGKLDELARGDTLLLINDFEPVPLFGEMQNRGYTYEKQQKGPSEWHIKISKP